MNVSLWFGGMTVYLAAAGVAGLRAWKGPLLKPDGLEIEVSLEGTQAAINAYLHSIERMLLDAAQNYALPGFDPVYVKIEQESVTWRSPVRAGSIEFLRTVASRPIGSQGIKVTLLRAGYWETDTPVSLPLTNCNGTNVTTGLLVDNHTDAGPHQNYADIPAGNVLGVCDTPAILSLERLGTDGMEILAGLARKAAGWDAVIEASTGTAGAGVVNAAQVDALSSSGTFQRLTWSGTGAVTLLSFTRTAAWTKSGLGLFYRPAARLANLVAGGERIWLWWRASYDNGVTIETLAESEPVLASTAQLWAVFPALRLPPWPVGDLTPASEAVCLQLLAQAEAPGAHTFDLDFAQFLPVEGWGRYVPLVGNLSGTKIYHDTGAGIIRRTATLMQTHFVEGGSFQLRPLAAHRLYFLARSGSSMVVDWEMTVKVEYRQRKIWL